MMAIVTGRPIYLRAILRASSARIGAVLAALTLAAALALGVASPAQAGNFNVACGDIPGLITAINSANSAPGADTITLAAACTYTLTAVDNGANGLPIITSDISFIGNGATIARSGAAPDFRMFEVSTSGTLTLNNLTLTGGRANNGGALYVDGAATAILNNSVVTGNTATNTASNGGGAIANYGHLTINSSALTNNTTLGSNGGAIDSDFIGTTLTVDSSTISGNAAASPGGGGAISNFEATATLQNSTISSNSALFGANLLNWATTNPATLNINYSTVYAPTGNAVDNTNLGTTTATAVFYNSILAAAGGPACANASVLTSDGYNLVTDGTCNLTATGDQPNTNPLLGPLANNGGPTPTHAVRIGSPAINAGDPAFSGSATDQRGAGFARMAGARVDIGAVESQVYVVNTTADSGTGCPSAQCAFRDAINQTNATGGGTIAFNIAGGGLQVIAPTSAWPDITQPVTLDGYTQLGASANTLSAGDDAVILIELNGDSCNCEGLRVMPGGGGSTIRGIAVGGSFNNGINLEGGSGSTVAGNFIGLHADGTPHGVAASGVYVDNTSNNVVGGATPAARNVISANRDGIFFAAGAADNTGNVVQGNYIGTTPAGSAAGPGNRDHGIFMGIFGPFNLTGNTIGGTGVGEGNVIAYNGTNLSPLFSPAAGLLLSAGTGNTIRGNQISGNTGPGVWVGATSTVIAGNKIGTDAAGTAALGNTGGGVVLMGSGNNVGGNVAGDRNIISGNSGDGVLIAGAGATTNTVAGNYIGTDAGGTAPLDNSISDVTINGCSNNLIGTNGDGVADAAERNILAGDHEILILGPAAANNVVAGNYVGTDVNGTTAMGGAETIVIEDAINTRIGTNGDGVSDTVERNVIVGGEAVWIMGGSSGTVVAGNYIGTDASGNVALGGAIGVEIENSTNNIVGTNGDGVNDAAERNIISGGGFGVWMFDASNNVVAGDYIGTNAAGTAPLPNGVGINVHGQSTNNRIGTNADGLADAAERNVISGNTGNGIEIVDAGTISNVVGGNYIGTNAAGNAALPNASGIVVQSGAVTNTIGGIAAGAGNTVAFNSGAGVQVDGVTGIAIRGNSIHDNGTGISLVNAGNDNQPAPGVTVAANRIADATPTSSLGGILTAAPNAAYTIDLYSNPSCTGAQGATYITSTTATTDGAGHATFLVAANPMLPANAAGVTATATDTAGNTSSFSTACATAAPLNDSWVLAAPLSPAPTASAAPYIFQAGQSRWYWFPVSPGGTVTVTVTGAAGTIVALDRDLNKIYNQLSLPQSAAALAANDLPGGYLPGGYLPGGYLPGGYLPGGYLPGGYLPGGYLPGGYLPGGYLPGGYLPGGYLVSGSSLPGGYLPGGYLPGGYLPGGYLPDLYSSAVRSGLLATAQDPAATTQTIIRNTWDLSENLYVMVTGPASLSTPVNVQVTLSNTGVCAGANLLPDPSPTDTIIQGGAPSGAATSLIVWDSHRMLTSSAQADITVLGTKLASFAQRPDVNGVVIDLADAAKYPRVAQANAIADSHPGCVAAKNGVATEIKRVVDMYRAVNVASGQTTVQYIVLVGSDYDIPFFRYPDVAGLANENEYIPPVADASASQASLRQGQVLGQDAYGAANSVTRSGFTLPVPQIAVGRLVRTAAEASAMLDAYVAASGVVAPSTGLTTGYDFVADAATAVRSELYQGLNPANCGTDPNNVPINCHPVDQLITPQGASLASAWTAANLRQSLFGGRHDLVFFAGHFSAGSLVAANYDASNTVQSSEVMTSSANFTNSLILALGCHSGYDIPGADATAFSPSPDWPEAFNARGATFVAATGYAYGDTDLTEYGERLYLNLAQQLRTGTGAVALGPALVAGKQAYLAQHVALVGLDDKTLIETTLYGLPMLKVNLPGQRILPNDPAIVSGVGPSVNTVGLRIGQAASGNGVTETISVVTSLARTDVQLTDQTTNNSVTASYFTGSGGVVARPAEPIFPLERRNVTVPGQILRGIGFRGGTYTDNSHITPLTSAATTEGARVHPGFYSDVLYPAQVWSGNYFDAIQGGATRLMVAPAQYQSSAPGAPGGTMRTFSELQFRLFYLDSNWTNLGVTDPVRLAAIAAAPNIQSVSGITSSLTTAQFNIGIQSDVDAPLQQAWVTWTDPSAPAPSQWQSADLSLTHSPTDTTQWQATGTATVPATALFMVQAANSSGLVSLATNGGAYYKLTAANAPAPLPLQPTALSLSGPASGAFGSTQSFSVTLNSGSILLANQPVLLSLNGQIAFGTTDGSGHASLALKLSQAPGSYAAQASFLGVPSGSVAGLAASSASAPFSVLKANSNLTLSPAGPVAIAAGAPTGIVARLTDGASQPLLQKSLVFVATNQANSSAVLLTSQTDVNGQVALGTTSLSAGAYTLRAYFSGNIPGVGQFSDDLYNPSVASLNLTVTQATNVLTVTANNQNRLYGSANPTLTVRYSGFVNGDTAAVLSGSPACTTTATTTSPAGTYPITCTVGTLAAANYTFTFMNGTLTVQKAPLTVTANNQTRVYGAPNPTFTVTYSGFVLGQTLATSGVTGSPACSTTATSSSAPGAYPITCTVGTLAASNYAFAFASGALTVGKSNSAVGLTASPNPSILAQRVIFTATVTAVAPGSGTPTGTVTFKNGTTVMGTAALNVAGRAVFTTTALPVGARAITASYGGNASFNAGVSPTLTQAVQYLPAGNNCLAQPGHQILPPIKADGSSVFYQGRRLIVRFRVCDFNGQSIGTPGVVTSFVLVKSVATTKSVNDTSDYDGDDGSWQPDHAFHWNPLRKRWFYELDTSTLKKGYVYYYRITLNDGTFIDFSFALR